jgi:tuftelin-interacting protein 11
MEPFEQVLQWSDLIRPSVFSQIIETEFFPKWLDVLHVWLIQPKANFAEVAKWYEFWKEEAFKESVRTLPGVARGFTVGLQLMFKATELGPEAPTKLQRPDFRAEMASPASSPGRNAAGKTSVPKPSARTHEITFRSIVEEFAASNNLLFMPTGRAHEKSRMPLFRVTPNTDGKGGILVYILDDAVWASESGAGRAEEDFRAIPLDQMVARANL